MPGPRGVEGTRQSPPRIYADTSVFGGCFDVEFQEGSRRFLDLVRRRRVTLLLSVLVRIELAPAPARVRNLIESLPRDGIQTVPYTNEVLVLRDAYLAAGIVGPRSRDDATHVAAATVGRADAIVSWNFRHIVGPGRIRGYNLINLRRGYGILTLRTPGEVLLDEEG